MTKKTYHHLLAPGRIGSLETRNRIVVAAMGVSLSDADGHAGERLIAYHERQAQGGAGLIISGVAGVAWPVGAGQPNQTAISDDRFLPGLSALTDRVHRHGAKIAVQLHHGGLAAKYSGDAFDAPIWGPCLPPPMVGDFPDYFLPEELAAFGGKQIHLKVMDLADIDTVVAQFGAAAVRAVKAGFDGIEIHGGHGYLLSSFLSPKTNTRTDDYGGALENRARLLLRVVEQVRLQVGRDFPVWVKLDTVERGKDGGIVLDDAVRTAKMLEATGVDAITATSYHDVGKAKLHSGSNIPHDVNANLAEASAIKAAVAIPVIASGRIEPVDGNRHIAEGLYDYLAMGRKLLADPMLPSRLIDGEPGRVRPCIYCYTCVSTAYVREPVRCAVNPEIGFEYAHRPLIATNARYVVIGGGPGGMEAASRLAEAGAAVTLIEEGPKLGGTLRIAALAYPANESLLVWLSQRVRSLGIDVRLRTRATTALVEELNPVAIIVATGARRDMPDVPGNDMPHVFSGDELRQLLMGDATGSLRRKTSLVARIVTSIGAASGLSANLAVVRKASKVWMPLGKHIVIVGGELVGIELAEYLMERGRIVTVLEPAPRLGKGLMLVRRLRLLAELKEHGVAMHGGVGQIRIERGKVRFADAAALQQSVPADHVIMAMGASGDTHLADKLSASGWRVETVGDCNGVSYIEGAIRGAAGAVERLLIPTPG